MMEPMGRNRNCVDAMSHGDPRKMAPVPHCSMGRAAVVLTISKKRGLFSRLRLGPPPRGGRSAMYFDNTFHHQF